MRRFLTAMVFVGALGCDALAQGLMGDVLAGKLLDPEVGVYAWYDLTDTATKKEFYLRQAIVGKQKVARKTAYWLETEIIPRVGFPLVYKMLLTGPASDPKFVHEIIVKEGTNPPAKIPLDSLESMEMEKPEERRSLGIEKLQYSQGVIEAEHFVITQGGRKTDVWLNEKVRPMGIVRMVSAKGELMLTSYGKGGGGAKSVIGGQTPGQANPPTPPPDRDFRVEVDKGVTTNFGIRKKP